MSRTSSRRVSRLHSKDPADAAWRAQQAQVDADIEGLSRDPEIEGITTREMIKRLKASRTDRETEIMQRIAAHARCRD